MHRVLIASLMLASSLAVAAQSRFSGTGVLLPTPARSADRRFALVAQWRQVPSQATTASRFAITARLRSKSAGASALGACGVVVDGVFADGFE